MLMFQFLPAQLGSITDAAAALKAQTTQAMRDGLLDSGKMLGEDVPLSCRCRFTWPSSNAGCAVKSARCFMATPPPSIRELNTFLGATVEDFAHVAAVTPTPGLGVDLFIIFAANCV